MSTKTLMSVEEYLHTVFDGADCEYLDGEIVERNMGELPHGRIQGRLIVKLDAASATLGLEVVPEIRLQINPRRYRVADIAVWRAGDIGTRIPTVPPFLAIEILSPEDRITRMTAKIQEYLAIGVEWIWIIDPEDRTALVYSRACPTGALSQVLRTENPDLEIPLSEVLPANRGRSTHSPIAERTG
jgi:Uma2 family endonuclease